MSWFTNKNIDKNRFRCGALNVNRTGPCHVLTGARSVSPHFTNSLHARCSSMLTVGTCCNVQCKMLKRTETYAPRLICYLEHMFM